MLAVITWNTPSSRRRSRITYTSSRVVDVHLVVAPGHHQDRRLGVTLAIDRRGVSLVAARVRIGSVRRRGILPLGIRAARRRASRSLASVPTWGGRPRRGSTTACSMPRRGRPIRAHRRRSGPSRRPVDRGGSAPRTPCHPARPAHRRRGPPQRCTRPHRSPDRNRRRSLARRSRQRPASRRRTSRSRPAARALQTGKPRPMSSPSSAAARCFRRLRRSRLHGPSRRKP